MINKLNLKKTKFFLIIYNILINAIFSYLFLITNATKCRSILRKSENKKPKISVFFLNKPNKVYFFSSNNFEIESLFKTFDKKFFNNNMPPEKITYRYDKTKSVSKKELNTQLQNLIEEIYNKKKQYKYFKILKQANFNRRKKSGLLILKFKDYPFIVKVFMENPKSFVSPYSKGLCPLLFFNMSGGMCRHLLGFTRIKNLHDLQNKILQDPKWSKKTIFPRKWYLLPKDPKYIKIIGTNFDNKNTIYDIINTVDSF
ncbi:MAG: hypothetical protein ACD_79C00096G0002 [uncultured bacterium]|nr:MAG: hypothetical protein ACD_79C00096G0002 [uncultured bacterium]KKP27102.1 MAG: hypothetical protein UR12_C0031G0009 [candidate division TM6 bacterium GW2011_GWF2_30_66]